MSACTVHRKKAKASEYLLDDARSKKIGQLINLGRGEEGDFDEINWRFLNGMAAAKFVPAHAVSA